MLRKRGFDPSLFAADAEDPLSSDSSPPLSRSGTPPAQVSPDFYLQPLAAYSELRRHIPDRHAPETTVARVTKTPRTEVSEPGAASTETTSPRVAPGMGSGFADGVVQGQWGDGSGVGIMGSGGQMGDLAFTGTEYFDFLDPFFQL
jgi:hypothetical protein